MSKSILECESLTRMFIFRRLTKPAIIHKRDHLYTVTAYISYTESEIMTKPAIIFTALSLLHR